MVLFLLDTYVEREEKFSSGKFSQKKIWEDIAEAMRHKIPLITGPQCAAKMRSLKKTYKSVKDHNSKSGNDRRTWLFYEVKTISICFYICFLNLFAFLD